jgi:NAD(P)-dependent dehydrogenase (short-subunit alcohol dehydrogenase family)
MGWIAMGRMQGKIALVTGGTRGIGRGIVEVLTAEGARVGFTGRTEATGREVEEVVAARGGEAKFIQADSGVESELAGAIAEVAKRFGGLTSLVNLAVAQEELAQDSHIDTIDNGTFSSVMRVALWGTYWGCKYAIPEMRKAGSGSIVNISASSSRSALPHRPAYHASKGAINALTRQLAADYGKDDIRANTIIVGFVYNGSPGMRSIMENATLREAFKRNIPVPRFGEPADIAAGATYLLSDEAKYVTGIELVIDGGALCHQAQPQLDLEDMRNRNESAAG